MNAEENQKPEDDHLSPSGMEDDKLTAATDTSEELPAIELTPDDHIAALQEQLLEARERTMRALADAENTRKRALKDREDAGKYAVSGFARDLLDFSDNFKRALDSLPEGIPEGVSEGLKAMEKDLLKVFDRHGIQKIEPLDEVFDANFHEVMFEAPMPGKAAGVIIQVVEPGYVLNGRLLRAAKVGIAKADSGNGENADPGAQIDIQG
ncbi:MAG: nucleotide exchange factor GrpE [Alphaproteobacteria bacterium]|nr:nucleotide exchange factor GrpE [Alphaproteobacteria bacterium]